MGLKTFIDSSMRVIKLIGRPERKDLWTSIKISLIGLTVLGVVAFIIKFIATLFTPAAQQT